MKIFLGLTNIASMYKDLREAFAERGVETFVVNKTPPGTIVTNYSDFNIQIAKDRVQSFRPARIGVRVKNWWDRYVDQYILSKSIKECDVFIFFWDTVYDDYSDLEKIKQAGKKIIHVFVGDDVRWYYGMKQEFSMYQMRPVEYAEGYDYSAHGLEARLKYLRKAERYADFIFSRLDQAQLELRPYYRWNMMVPSRHFVENNQQRSYKPVIAHAPSNRSVKGTQYVLEAFERLKNEGIEFESCLVENVSNTEAIKLYGNADILIDQLLCPGTGKLATEALACGTIVMGHMAYDKYPQKNPPDCPVIDVNPDTLYPKLKALIADYDFRKEHARKGRPYVEKYLEVGMFCDTVLSLLQGEKLEYDYQPVFFRDCFIPESVEATAVYNKWTKEVIDCDWYKQYINPGERSGLVF